MHGDLNPGCELADDGHCEQDDKPRIQTNPMTQRVLSQHGLENRDISTRLPNSRMPKLNVIKFDPQVVEVLEEAERQDDWILAEPLRMTSLHI